MTRQRPRLRITADGKEARARSRRHWFIQKAREEAREEDEQAERDHDALDAYDDMVRRDVERRADLDKQRWRDRKWAALAAVIFFALLCYLHFVLWRPL